jgi:hypothetical protein
MLGIRFIPNPTVSTEHVLAGPAGFRGDPGAVAEWLVGLKKFETSVEVDAFFFRKGDGSESGSEWLYRGDRWTAEGVTL